MENTNTNNTNTNNTNTNNKKTLKMNDMPLNSTRHIETKMKTKKYKPAKLVYIPESLNKATKNIALDDDYIVYEVFEKLEILKKNHLDLYIQITDIQTLNHLIKEYKLKNVVARFRCITEEAQKKIKETKLSLNKIYIIYDLLSKLEIEE